jgi:hypothetical protein
MLEITPMTTMTTQRIAPTSRTSYFCGNDGGGGGD